MGPHIEPLLFKDIFCVLGKYMLYLLITANMDIYHFMMSIRAVVNLFDGTKGHLDCLGSFVVLIVADYLLLRIEMMVYLLCISRKSVIPPWSSRDIIAKWDIVGKQ